MRVNADYSLCGYELETPLVNAAGSINGTNKERILQEVETLAATAIGAITVGSFTVTEQVGNEAKYGRPTYYHNPKTGLTYNSMGLPNVGLVAAKRLMPEIVARAHDRGKPVIASVAPTVESSETGNTFEQLVRLVYEMQLAGADLVEVNTSCPNTVTADGGRKPIIGHDLEAMHKLMDELAFWTGSLDSKTGIKLPPYTIKSQRELVPDLAWEISLRQVFGFVAVCNTVEVAIPINQSGKHLFSIPGGTCGLSGPETRSVGRDQLLMWSNELSKTVPIISTEGVASGRELAWRREHGATAAGGVTFLWENHDWGAAVTKIIGEWVDEGAP